MSAASEQFVRKHALFDQLVRCGEIIRRYLFQICITEAPCFLKRSGCKVSVETLN